MFYNNNSPWILKAALVVVFFGTRDTGHTSAHQVVSYAVLPAALQLALLVSSVFLPVRSRARTTILVSETTFMIFIMCLVLYAGIADILQPMECAMTLQMTVMHVFYQQCVAFHAGRQLVAMEAAWMWLTLACSILIPMWMITNMAGKLLSTKSMLVMLFVGEIFGALASILAIILGLVATWYESVSGRHE